MLLASLETRNAASGGAVPAARRCILCVDGAFQRGLEVKQMFKTTLLAASLVLAAGVATAGIIDPCRSTVVFNGSSPECYFACPAGDTDSFIQAGFSFSFRIVDFVGSRDGRCFGRTSWNMPAALLRHQGS
jgi:hypothetical protein